LIEQSAAVANPIVDLEGPRLPGETEAVTAGQFVDVQSYLARATSVPLDPSVLKIASRVYNHGSERLTC
jgi:hypothetical protein